MGKVIYFLRIFLNKNIINFFLKISNKIYLKGQFNNWESAEKLCNSGYSSNEIFKNVKKKFLISTKNNSYLERDGLLIKKNKNIDTIIKYYLKCLRKNNKNIKILDVGGGTGYIYFKNIRLLNKNKNLKWIIFEQKKVIDFLKKNIKIKQFIFTNTIKKKFKNNINIVLLQSSLQYFKKPYKLLNKLISLDPEYLIIDETPFSNNQKEIVKIQVIPERIYNVKYPLHILNERKIIQTFRSKYSLIEKKNCIEGLGGYNYRCLVFHRLKNGLKKKKV